MEDIPVIISFHKFDPQVRGKDYISGDINKLKEDITNKHPNYKILYQQTSIFDIISIIQLVSYALSVFDKAFSSYRPF